MAAVNNLGLILNMNLNNLQCFFRLIVAMKNGTDMLLLKNTLGSWISLFVLLLLKLRGSLQGIVSFCVPCNSDMHGRVN